MMHTPGFTKTSPATFIFILSLSTGTAFAQDSFPGGAPPAPPPQSSQVVSDLFRPLGRDMRGMLSRDNLFIAGIGGLGATAGAQFDNRATGFRWNPTLGSAMEPGKIAGGFVAQAGGALAAYAIGRATDSPKVTSLGASLFRAQFVSQTTVQTIKFAVRRTRPDGTILSFPSGHSASAFATASVLQAELGWKIGVPAYGAAAWVAASRVHAKRHYLSDVIAGATIGIMAGRSVTVGKGQMKFAMSPAAVPRGIALNFVKVGA